MPSCAVVNCTNSSKKGFKLFSFPSDETRRNKWIQNMRRKNWTATRFSRICERHFEESQFEKRRADGVRKPKPNAIPTLFDVPNPPPRIDPLGRKSLFKVSTSSNIQEEKCGSSYLNPPVKRVISQQVSRKKMKLLKETNPLLVEHSYTKYQIKDDYPNEASQQENDLQMPEVCCEQNSENVATDTLMEKKFTSMQFDAMVPLENIANKCRICLLEEGSTSIYAIAEQQKVEIQIHEVLQSYTNSQIDENDILPKYICQTCFMELLKTHDFLKKCKKSDEILQKIKNINVEKENEVEEKVNVETCENSNQELVSKPTSNVLTKSSIGTCKICFKRITKYKMKRHMMTHSRDKPYKCSYCSAGFSVMGNLMRHQRTHTGEKPYKCDVCPKAFTRSNYLNDHKNIHLGVKPYCCHICAATYYSSQNLKVHLLSHQPSSRKVPSSRTCKTCNKILHSKSSYYAHMMIHQDRVILCSLCGRQFSQKGNFILHWRCHTGERPFSCDLCSKKFSGKQALANHKVIHSGKKPYECTICTKAFAQRSGLKRHLLLHKGVKSHVCEYCGKKFAEKCNLVVHIRIHTGETPYHCGICSKRFYDGSSLKKHLKAVHQHEIIEEIINQPEV